MYIETGWQAAFRVFCLNEQFSFLGKGALAGGELPALFIVVMKQVKAKFNKVAVRQALCVFYYKASVGAPYCPRVLRPGGIFFGFF
ncbi:MAG: hypothetical protein DRI61_11940 [Chloroflexi bacterium]|nr:MAG: hypothetical protein DRI61_11940 [Chloroflexota bacterium]